MGEHPTITLQVNGRSHEVTVDPTTPVMYPLRNDLGCAGVRAGCSIGECGACRIIVDGEAVPSCITPVSEVEGAAIVTPEGLGTPDAPHPVQQAFLDEQAGQCGYCVNGVIVSVAAHVDRHPDTDGAALVASLEDHLCRCGTQLRLLRAAARAAGLAPDDLGIGPGPTADDRACEPLAASEDGTTSTGLPPVVAAHPTIGAWLEVSDDARVVAAPGKVELGQGVRTALRLVVASQLQIPVDRVDARPTVTGRSPDQGQTSGSFSIEQGGEALAMAARALRRVLLDRAAAALGRDVEELHLTAEVVGTADGDAHVGLAALARDGGLEVPIEPGDRPVWDAAPLGEPAVRDDLRAKLTGAPAYVQDLAPPEVLHARVVLPPSLDASLDALDLDGVRALPGVVEVVHDARLLLVVADREEAAIRAASRLAADVTFTPGPGVDERSTEALLRSLPAEEHVRRRDEGVAEALTAGRTHAATYVKPYQAHGAMSPSAAVARLDDGGRLKVWTHSQGVYPLRRELAAHLGVDEDDLEVHHLDGPGCYGMNGADDAAMFAAIAARAVPGRPVRFRFSITDEFDVDPYGPGMVGDLRASLTDDGRIAAWQHRVVTDSHSTRPNGDGDRLLAAWLGGEQRARPWVGRGEPALRNAEPLYDLPLADLVADEVRGPLRTGPLRSLGAFFNVFAGESFVDELAELAGRDPVAFRLDHLGDPRARRVLELAAARAGWEPHVGPSGRGLGAALARYKDTKGYCALVAGVEVDGEQGTFRVTRVVAACDAGTVVDLDGLRNQVEGGVLQGISRTLYEELTPAQHGVRERDWTTYGSLRFADVPPVEVAVVDRPGAPPLGAGEISTPPVPAAVANALDDALGVRVRQLPITPDRLQRRLLELDEAEMARVRL